MWLVLALLTAVTVFLCRNKRYRWFYIIIKTFRRDVRGLAGYVKINVMLRMARFQNNTVANVFTKLVKKHPQKVAFLFEDDVWTFLQVEDFSNKIAKYFAKQGFQKGDCVALMLENTPEYPCIWLGLSKIGVVTALINTNLVKDSLLHSIKSANSKGVIFGSNHAEVMQHIREDLKLTKLYQFHESSAKNVIVSVLPNCIDLRNELGNVSDDPLEKTFQVSVQDPLLYIYTSGTTGLPKAAVVSNIRYAFGAWGLFVMARFKSNDILYNPLPFYHSAGGMLGLGQTMLCGMTVAIRKKFSASNYWKDCARYECTAAQYVGEICRYILAAHENESVKHRVRAICGNGLRPQIWKQFVEKFDIKEVYELYGATEGISNMINIDNTVGSVGFIPRHARWIYPVTLIRCNETTGEPIRGENGRCIECEVNESGLLIGKIKQKKSIFNFQGYADKGATEKKILQNVFRDGDSYFNSGDILLGDELGNFFFKDRTGDTFRWKGENVSTSEVEAVISNLTQLNDAVVFGVQIPETEGRAGMAAIVDITKSLDLNLLSSGLKANLPAYTIPLFVRVMKSVPLTGTYKLKKVELQSEGYNVNKINDKIYFYDPKLKTYVNLTKDLHEKIVTGKLSL